MIIFKNSKSKEKDKEKHVLLTRGALEKMLEMIIDLQQRVDELEKKLK